MDDMSDLNEPFFLLMPKSPSKGDDGMNGDIYSSALQKNLVTSITTPVESVLTAFIGKAFMTGLT